MKIISLKRRTVTTNERLTNDILFTREVEIAFGCLLGQYSRSKVISKVLLVDFST